MKNNKMDKIIKFNKIKEILHKIIDKTNKINVNNNIVIN